jgi:prepilin signal peptidase PulO-like enzyme (type II secretory pathway)
MAAEEAVTAPRAVTWSAPPALVAVGVIAVAALSFAKFEDIGQAIVAAIFSGVLLVLAAIDLERRIIPNRIVLPAGAVVLAGNVLADTSSTWEYVISATVALAVASLISLASRGGLGMGDAKLCFLLGAGLGWNVIGALLFASIGAFIAAVTILVRRGVGARKETFAFGPFLAAGGILALFLS